jgi:TRAP-type C4-dicarboxylate transport system permease large subunit
VLQISENPIVVLLLINLILLIVGCFLETVAAITILVPVLLPIAIIVASTRCTSASSWCST